MILNEEDRLVERFTETVESRNKRIRSKKIDPETEKSVRRLLKLMERE